MTTPPATDTTWMQDGLCAQTGPDDHTWFPGTGPVPHTTLKVCAACPVRERCLEYALELEGDASRWHRAGIWGGTTPPQRADIARRRREAA